MSPELSIVKLFLNYNEWATYRDKLSVADLPKEIRPLYSLLDNYHSSNEQQADLTLADAANLVAAAAFKDKDYYLEVLTNLQQLEVSTDTTSKLVQRIIANKQLNEISLAAHEAKEGRRELEDVNKLIAQFTASQNSTEEEEEDLFVTDDLDSLLNDVYQKPGLKWRLNTMNKMLGSLRDGNFGFIFARPETGKTTFLASELTFMAEQATGDVIWLANEEDGKGVKLRLYQATFGVTLTELLANPKKWKDLFQQKYGNRLKLISDPSVMTKNNVQRLCDKLKPSLLIIDQLSKIGGFAADRKDLELGAACEWGRTMAKSYCPTVAVHQADGTADGVKWLTMNHVANAKTAMQAEADWILGIGKVFDPGYENLRFLALSKNKLPGDANITDPNLRHGKMEVIINAPIARYEDIQ